MFLHKSLSFVAARSLVAFGKCFLPLVIAASCFADTNVAPASSIKSTPYVGSAISLLTDGGVAARAESTLMMAAPLPLRTGQTMPVTYEFTFPRRLPITRVRLFQHLTQGRRPATGYVIELDANGLGAYQTTIAKEAKGRGGEWFSYSLSPPVMGYALRFRTTGFPEGSGPNYGASAVGEIEIFTNAEMPLFPAPSLPDAPLLEVDLANARKIAAARRLQPPAPGASAQFHRGLFGSMWLYWAAGSKYSEQANAGKMALLERLGVNRYWLYPGVYILNDTSLPYLTLPRNADYLHFIARQLRSGSSQTRIVPFPSQVVAGYRENVLSKFVAQMHASGIRVVANESLLPYGLSGWDFPRVMDPNVYPSVLSSSFVRNASTTLYRELMESGVDGIALGGDEFFLYGTAGIGEDLSPVCRGDEGRARDICKPTTSQVFAERFPVDAAPRPRAFSPLAAKWTVFGYEQLGRLFASYGRMMREVNPDAIVTSLFRAGEENRPAWGIAYDVMGGEGAVAEMSSNPYWSHDSHLGHYYFANLTKKLIGASRSRTGVITLQTTPRFDRDGYEDPVMVYGPAISSLMHGARGINFYKQDYLFAGGRNDAGPWVEKFFNLTVHLETKGLLEFRVPRSVALVYSRASEDWWQLAHQADPVQAAEAILYQNAVMEVLFRHGIPFDLYYLDRPADLDRLSEYRTAILAYPYSMGKETLPRITAAIKRGTKVIAVQRRGEVDEFAQPHRNPLLAELPGVKHFSIDLTRSSYGEFSGQFVPELMQALGGKPPLVLAANSKDVECSTLENADRRLVFCLNWEKQRVAVNLGVTLPDGTYSATVITMDSDTPARIHGNARLSAGELAHFRLVLAAGEAKILAIDPLPPAADARH